MNGLPVTTYTEVNKSVVPPRTLRGTHGVITPTLFGQADKAYTVNSVSDLTSLFGGPGVGSPFFAQLRRAVARGTTLRIQRLLGTAATTATYTFVAPKVSITAKDFGAFANGKLGITYLPVAGPAKAILTVVYTPDTTLNEIFSASTFDGIIAAVNAGSKRISITTSLGYTELPAVVTPQFLATGSDGTFASDAARDTAVQALFANLNNYTDLSTVSALGSYSSAHVSNLRTYSESRGDIIGIFEIDPSITPAAAVTFAQALGVTSSFMAGYYGSFLTANSPEESIDVAGPVLMDVASVYSVSDTIAGNTYKAPAGSRRGLIPNVKTFAFNMLSPANLTNANSLNQAGINIVGNDPTFGPVVWGAQTMAQSNSSFDAINVRRSLFQMRALLMPIFKAEQFEPMNPVSWREAYGKAKTVLDAMVSASAIYSNYTYVGDQEASTISQAKYNDPTDLANGKYKVQLLVVFTGYIHDVAVEVDVNNLLTLFNAGVTI